MNIEQWQRIVLVGGLLSMAALPAAAQEVDVDGLWERYDEQATAYETLQAECDEGDRTTTLVNRRCRESADASLALAQTIQDILEFDTSLDADDRELLLDGMLTNRQIAGSLWVELGECEDGRMILTDLLDDEGMDVRPLVAQAAQNWIDRADQCLIGQREETVVAVDEPPPSNRTTPIVVMGGGMGLLAGGVVWDLAMGSNRNEFTELQEQCTDPTRGCNDTEIERLDEVAGKIDNAKIPIAILYGTGAAVAVGGAIWYVLAGRTPDDADVAVRPTFSSGGIGAQVRVRF